MQDIQVFKFRTNEVRTENKDGETFFVAKDVCDILGISKYRDVLSKMRSSQRESINVDTLGGNQTLSGVNEPGLYWLIFQSKKPEAELFQDWVTSEVLPSIRKTGSYQQLPQTFSEALLLAGEQAKQLELQAPKVEFAEAVMGSDDTISMSEVAKVLNMGIGRNKIFKILRDNKILQENNQPYQQYCDKGMFRVIESKYGKPNGDTCIQLKTVVYQRGLDYIRKLLEE